MRRSLPMMALCLLLACRGQVDTTGAPPQSGAKVHDPNAPPAATPPTSPGAQAVGAYRITCSVYHRDLGTGTTPPPEHQRESLVFRSDQPGEQAVEVSTAKIPVLAKLAPTTSPDRTTLTMSFPRTGLAQDYELSTTTKPPHDFVGGHGFSGLNYIATPDASIDVQYICEASELGEERPLSCCIGAGAGGGPPATPPAPKPILCDVSITGVTTKTESVRIVPATGFGSSAEMRVTHGSLGVALSFHASQFDGGGSFVVQVRSGHLEAGFRHQQLFQGAYPNQLHGPGALTGQTRVTVDAATASVACKSEE